MSDESAIRELIAEWGEAFCSKDCARLMALYRPAAVIFDAIPPFASGLEPMRAKVEDCFRYFPAGFAIETRDLTVVAGGDLAAAHFLWHFTGLPPGHPAGRHWLRSSLVLNKAGDGPWRIVHDHCSAPFDPYTEKVVLTPDPGTVSQPAPGSCGERNPVGWFEIYVDDMARAKAFYGAMLGVEFTPLQSPIELWAFPMLPGGQGITGALARLEGGRPEGNAVLVYFSCDDCGVTAERAVAAGGQLHKPKFAIGQYGYIALAVDSEGNMIGLHSMN